MKKSNAEGTSSTGRSSYLSSLTAEERSANLAKARQARQDKLVQLQNNEVRTEYMDSEFWNQLYRDRHIRKVNVKLPLTVQSMRKYSRKMGMGQKDMEHLLGCTFQQFIDMNPNWSLYAFGGICLELTNQ